MNNDCFQLKGSVITTFILEFNDYNSFDFEQQLIKKVQSAPDFFSNSPVIINLEKLGPNAIQVDYRELISICQRHGLQPVAFKQSPQLHEDQIKETGLALLNQKACGKPEQIQQIKEKTIPAFKKTLVITKTVRSGQQVYAEGCDLIITGSVSGGAEVLADGNIHIYGTLRGRALAGVKGDLDARIFCSTNEAELVSIGGHFLLSDSLETQVWKQAAQFYLLDEALHVSQL